MKIIIIIFLLFSLVLPQLSLAHGDESDGHHLMMGSFGSNSMGWFGLGWVFMILFWILIVIGIVALIKWLTGQGTAIKSSSASEILKERFAKGEINQEEYQRMKKELIK